MRLLLCVFWMHVATLKSQVKPKCISVMDPSFEHHTCMVVAGDFDMALSVIKTMPSSHYPPVWVALLSACRKWGNLELGRLAFDQVVQIDDNLAEAYVFMANIYVAAGVLNDAEKVEAMIRMKKMEM